MAQDNLEEDGILALLVFDAEGTVAHIYLWVGSDSWLSCERDKEIYEVAREFVDAKGLPTDVEVPPSTARPALYAISNPLCENDALSRRAASVRIDSFLMWVCR